MNIGTTVLLVAEIYFQFARYVNMKFVLAKINFLSGVLSGPFPRKCQIGFFVNFCRFTHWFWKSVRF